MGWQVYVAVTIGSALGGLARYLVSNAIPSEDFPWATLFINIVGSFVIGFFATLTAVEGRLPASPEIRVFVMAGICGGFTTFSAFSLQALDLVREQELGAAAGYVLGSVALCLLAVWLGYVSATAMNPANGG